MSKPVYVVFGETTQNDTNSNYTYANALTFDIMDKLGRDKRFLDCTQADVLNLALVILYGFMKPCGDDKVSKAKLHDFVEDYVEFKDFAMFTMNTCRAHNVSCNGIIDEMIEKELKE